jgi:pilus assembly protein Flp/PilA
MLSNLRKVMRDTKDRGASAVEYGLMVAAIAAVIVGIVFGLGTIVGNTFKDTCSSLTSGGQSTAGAATNTCAPAK